MATVTTPATTVSPLDLAPRGLVFGVFCIVIVIQYVYALSFNWSPELRAPLSGALAAINVVLAGLTILLRPAAWNLMLLLSASLMSVTLIPSHALGLGEVRGLDLDELARKLVLPLMYIWVLAYPLALPRLLLVSCATVAALVGAAIAVTGEPVMVSGTPRLASITGALTQMHPSAKFMTMHLILFDLFRRAGFVRPWFSWAMIALCGTILLGYGARSDQLFVAVYYLSFAYWHYRQLIIVRIAPLYVAAIAVVASLLLLALIPSVVNQWGSGRINHWQYRLDLLAQRDLATLLFGGGVGSDIQWSASWWWMPEVNAHSDFLYYLTEHGVVGLVVLGLIICALWIRSGVEGRALLAGAVASSSINNGYFRSPLTATFLIFAFAVALCATIHRQTNLERNRRLDCP